MAGEVGFGGWWRDDEGAWRPPEEHPDPAHRARFTAPSAQTGYRPWAATTKPKGRRRPRRRRAALVVALVVSVAVVGAAAAARALDDAATVLDGGPGGLPAAPGACHPAYASPCVPVAADVDCAGAPDAGPVLVSGPVVLVDPGDDPYGLDPTGSGVGCT
jgi:hypothetical protein